jgi:predicted nucleic-acid-binding Zn-ribbon protein
MNDIQCPNCRSTDIEVAAPPSLTGTNFWDYATCSNCGYPNLADFDTDYLVYHGEDPDFDDGDDDGDDDE